MWTPSRDMWGRGRKIALDVAMGLAFLHSHNVVHLDIKSGNVLLARNMTAKISDVGLARQLQSSNSSIKGVGTFEYAAPEVLTGEMKVGKLVPLYFSFALPCAGTVAFALWNGSAVLMNNLGEDLSVCDC